MKILLAEDDGVSRLLMRRTLQSFGYEVILAQNGREAAEILAQADGPRLALVDWMMPELDGLALCREVRSREVEGAYVYIVLLTSKQNSEDIVAGLGAGADDYLTKPCPAAELRARLHTGQRILSLEEKLVEAREEMRHQATHDGLTGTWNRAAILSLANSEVFRSSISVLLCDVDHFKKINDSYGHLAGDLVLQEIASRLSSAVRGCDAVGRYGGEEFLIILNDCEDSVLHARADEIRTLISSSPVQANQELISVTISIGAATLDVDDAPITIEQVLALADAALYQAKRLGRNRVILADRLVINCTKPPRAIMAASV